MKVYPDKNLAQEFAGAQRAHPWQQTNYGDDPDRQPGHYYDLKAYPELITTALEDFSPWNDQSAIQAFYKLLGWLNSSESHLETNDCAFSGPPKQHPDKGFPEWKLRCDGRLMIFYRDLAKNTEAWQTEHLVRRFMMHVQKTDPKFGPGAIGVATAATQFLELMDRPGNGLGRLMVFRFFAFGNTQAETFEHLERVFRGTLQALKRLSGEIAEITAASTKRKN